ncbi:BlaR1 family beta-lactam sensor/signal transducer [Lacrimispora xylanisolvens]|uniref:BlaR1 family beta-lactam sensor/signal transducer n=1 Tax=Lacrimispora xylanisolvens TaxID=384636 RepID=UPI00240296D2
MLLSLMIRLMLNSVVIILSYGIILLIKELFKNHLTWKAQYRIWYYLLLVLIFPFLPSSMIHAGLRLLSLSGGSVSPVRVMTPTFSNDAGISSFIQDFSISVSRSPIFHLPAFLPYIWGLGIGTVSILNLISDIKIRRIRQASLPLQNRKIRELFDCCLSEMNIKKKISLYSSAYLSSPVAAGLVKPVIILPIHMLSEFTEEEIRFILLHELTHIKHRDLLNRFLALMQALYWYHPVVWIGLSEMRKDQEVYCDLSVLSMLEENSYLDYGKTLIRFAENMARRLSFVSQIAGSEKEIRRRIRCIASYRKETTWKQWKSRFLLTATSLVLLAFIPVMSVNASSGSFYPFYPEHMKQLDLDTCFYGFEGSFILYGVNSHQYYIYNQKAGTTRISPDSTYKIYSALCALDQGVITPDSSYIKWDGSAFPFEAWNQDQNLNTAMSRSVNWYFKALDEKSGISALKGYTRRLEYGNQDLSGGIGSYWLESSLKISPVEQVELLTRLCQGTLPFQPDHIKAVKDSLYISDSQGVSLYGKTGTGNINGKDVNGWFIGFAQSQDETYVFSTNIQSDQSANGRTAAAITLDILESQNIYRQ